MCHMKILYHFMEGTWICTDFDTDLFPASHQGKIMLKKWKHLRKQIEEHIFSLFYMQICMQNFPDIMRNLLSCEKVSEMLQVKAENSASQQETLSLWPPNSQLFSLLAASAGAWHSCVFSACLCWQLQDATEDLSKEWTVEMESDVRPRNKVIHKGRSEFLIWKSKRKKMGK